MRVACFTPLPPAVSGIADYSEALLHDLRLLCEVDAFTGPGDPSSHDVALYQIGNNDDHIGAYETALKHPGVVVLHEANLHHLVAALTIKRGDWDAYLREVEFEGGQSALDYAKKVRALETGPDYDGLPMLRRLLSTARGLIAHSDYVIDQARQSGYTGPAARIPHGAWIPDADRMAYRHKLGLDETTPLIGIFGHLKPYKRIAESIRAFRRVAKREPKARMILVGEPHPELNLPRGLDPAIRLLGRAAIEDFTGYLSACDIVLNLRHPTVGETSGTLLRAFGLGKAAVVSNVGAVAEFSDQICLKTPIDATEEDTLTEYLTLLVQRRDLARQMGNEARKWVERECSWPHVARLYANFLEGREEPPPPPAATTVSVEPEYIQSWSETQEERQYVETHLDRLERTIALIPAGGPEDRILEMGAYMQITPALKTRLGYGEVRGCYYGPPGKIDHKEKVSTSGETYACDLDLFDAEQDRFPYPDAHFSTVLCCELIEHLPTDPMFMMSEINRILKEGGHLVLTTPNIGSLRAISAILQGYHPGFFPAYLKPGDTGDARHAREYTPKEMTRLLIDAGFTITSLETGPFREQPHPELAWVADLLDRYGLPKDQRGDGLYIVGRKSGPVRDRWPTWLYG